MKTITLEQGKYIIEYIDDVGLQARRYGEPWRDLTGDKLVLALVQRVEALEAARKDAQICGVGFTVDGVRVDPSRVVVFR